MQILLLAAVQSDVNQNESDADTAIALKFDKAGGTLTGSLSIAKSFPDIELKSGDEKRLIFADAGGAATAALKHVGTTLDFYAGGIASGNKEFVVADGGVTVPGTAAFDGNVTISAERLFFSNDAALIRLSDNKAAALTIENHDGTAAEFVVFNTQNAGLSLTTKQSHQHNNTLTVGVDDTGFDVKFHGATASAYMLWDESADDLILAGAAGLVVPEGQLTIGATAVTASGAELNYVDGVTSAIQTQLDAKLASSGAKAALDVDHLITLSGVSAAADSLGTFTGSTISDNGTIKAGIQEVETALELRATIAGPTFTGTPAAPTAAQATNTTQVATTAFVQSNLTAALLRTALGITTNAGDPGDSRGMYFDSSSSKYLISS